MRIIILKNVLISNQTDHKLALGASDSWAIPGFYLAREPAIKHQVIRESCNMEYFLKWQIFLS